MEIKLYNKVVNEKIISGIIKKIKEKKELANLDEILCYDKITSFLAQNNKVLKRMSEHDKFSDIEKSKEIKTLVKEVRKEIRKVYGLFQTKDISKAKNYLDQLKEELNEKSINETIETHNKILLLNVSSGERIDFYSEFYRKIFEITGYPNSIFEIASGFNPISFPYMRLYGTNYIASELNTEDVKLIKKYFSIIKKKTQINGIAFKLDLTKDEKEVKKYKADLCIVLKLFDLIDPKITEKTINDLNVKWIVASFPTKTVANIDMRFKRRAGFQKMLRRLGLDYKTIEFNNEIVYIIKK